MEVCLSIADVRVPQIGCKQRQCSSWIFAGMINTVQIACCKGMTKVVEPGIAPLYGLNAQLLREDGEYMAHSIIGTPFTSLVYEKRGFRPFVMNVNYYYLSTTIIFPVFDCRTSTHAVA